MHFPRKYVFQSLVYVVFCSMPLLAQTTLSREGGITAYRSGDFEKTANALQIAVTTDKSDKLAWIYLGAAFVKLGKEKEAIDAFKNSSVDYKNPIEILDQDVNIIRKPRGQYTELARQHQVQGTVKLAIEYQADGTIGFVFPFQPLPDGLTESTVEAAKSIEFEPAKNGGKTVTVVKIQAYNYNIY